MSLMFVSQPKPTSSAWNHEFIFQFFRKQPSENPRADCLKTLSIFKAIEHLFRVHMISSKHEKGLENSRQSCQFET